MAVWADGKTLEFLPEGAFKAGKNVGGPMLICRVEYEGNLILGMVVQLNHRHASFVFHFGSRRQVEEYEVLMNSPGITYSWRTVRGDSPVSEFAGAVVTGKTADGEDLYSARTTIDGVNYCGWFQVSQKKAYNTIQLLEEKRKNMTPLKFLFRTNHTSDIMLTMQIKC